MLDGVMVPHTPGAVSRADVQLLQDDLALHFTQQARDDQ
jgi:hypothetical protein